MIRYQRSTIWRPIVGQDYRPSFHKDNQLGLYEKVKSRAEADSVLIGRQERGGDQTKFKRTERIEAHGEWS